MDSVPCSKYGVITQKMSEGANIWH